MARFEVTVEVNAPLPQVWEAFMNIDNMPHWMDGFQSIENRSKLRLQKILESLIERFRRHAQGLLNHRRCQQASAEKLQHRDQPLLTPTA